MPMFYEEKKINGVTMWRNTPGGNWKFNKGDLAAVIGSVLLEL
jgi:hypothetical protein